MSKFILITFQKQQRFAVRSSKQLCKRGKTKQSPESPRTPRSLELYRFDDKNPELNRLQQVKSSTFKSHFRFSVERYIAAKFLCRVIAVATGCIAELRSFREAHMSSNNMILATGRYRRLVYNLTRPHNVTT